MKFLDLENWNRKELFYFFREYEQPFFNICADVDVTSLVKFTKDRNISFFKASLYLSLKAANEIEPFRYRIRENKVIVHEVIDGGLIALGHRCAGLGNGFVKAVVAQIRQGEHPLAPARELVAKIGGISGLAKGLHVIDVTMKP